MHRLQQICNQSESSWCMLRPSKIKSLLLFYEHDYKVQAPAITHSCMSVGSKDYPQIVMGYR